MLDSWADAVTRAGPFGMLATLVAIVGALACLLTFAMGVSSRPLALRVGAVSCLLCALAVLVIAHAGPGATLVIALWGTPLPIACGAAGLAVARSWREPLERDALTPLGVVVALACVVAWGMAVSFSTTPTNHGEPTVGAAPAVAQAPPKRPAKVKRRKVVKLEPIEAAAPMPPPTPPPVVAAQPPPPEVAEAPAPPPPAEPTEVTEPEGPDYREALAAMVRSKRGQLRACYEAELKKEPTLKGKVVVAFSVTPAGRIGETSIEENTMASDAVASCIRTLMRGWQFPFRPSDELHAEYPFIFAPGK